MDSEHSPRRHWLRQAFILAALLVAGYFWVSFLMSAVIRGSVHQRYMNRWITREQARQQIGDEVDGWPDPTSK